MKFENRTALPTSMLVMSLSTSPKTAETVGFHSDDDRFFSYHYEKIEETVENTDIHNKLFFFLQNS